MSVKEDSINQVFGDNVRGAVQQTLAKQDGAKSEPIRVADATAGHGWASLLSDRGTNKVVLPSSAVQLPIGTVMTGATWNSSGPTNWAPRLVTPK